VAKSTRRGSLDRTLTASSKNRFISVHASSNAGKKMGAGVRNLYRCSVVCINLHTGTYYSFSIRDGQFLIEIIIVYRIVSALWAQAVASMPTSISIT